MCCLLQHMPHSLASVWVILKFQPCFRQLMRISPHFSKQLMHGTRLAEKASCHKCGCKPNSHLSWPNLLNSKCGEVWQDEATNQIWQVNSVAFSLEVLTLYDDDDDDFDNIPTVGISPTVFLFKIKGQRQVTSVLPSWISTITLAGSGILVH